MIAILGGGISGLALGCELDRRDVPFQLLEAGSDPGGVIKSARVDGHVLDWGPQRIRLTEPLEQLIRELGLGDQVISASGDSTLWVHHSGKLRRIPFDPWEFLTTDALSLKGKARLLLEPLFAGADPDESVARYLRRKLGDEVYEHIVGPLYGGLYSSDPADMVMGLSLGHVLREFGIKRSLLVRLLRSAGRIPRPPAISFAEGMATLPRAMAERLGDRVSLDSPAQWLRREGEGWEVGLPGGETFFADQVVLATPAPVAARLLAEAAPDASRRIGRLRYNPIGVVHVESDAEMEGLGFKVSFAEDTPLRGVTYNHAIFGRTGLYTVYLGGSSHPEAVALPDEELAALAESEFQRTVGRPARTLAVGRERMPAWDATWAGMRGMILPEGLHLLANWQARPGVPGRLAHALRLGASLAEAPTRARRPRVTAA